MSRTAEREEFKAALARGGSPLTTPYEQVLAKGDIQTAMNRHPGSTGKRPFMALQQEQRRAGRVARREERAARDEEREKLRAEREGKRNEAIYERGQRRGTAKPGKGRGRTAKPGKGRSKTRGSGKVPTYRMPKLPETAADRIRAENVREAQESSRASGSGGDSGGGGDHDVSGEARDDHGKWTKGGPRPLMTKYSDDQPRDERGRWTLGEAIAASEGVHVEVGTGPHSYREGTNEGIDRRYGDSMLLQDHNDPGGPRIEIPLTSITHITGAMSGKNYFTAAKVTPANIGSTDHLGAASSHVPDPSSYRGSNYGMGARENLRDYYHEGEPGQFKAQRKAERKAFKARLARGGSPMIKPYEQVIAQKYSDDEARDEHGRWAADGGVVAHEEAQTAIERALERSGGHHGNALDIINSDPKVSPEAKAIAGETLQQEHLQEWDRSSAGQWVDATTGKPSADQYPYESASGRSFQTPNEVEAHEDGIVQGAGYGDGPPNPYNDATLNRAYLDGIRIGQVNPNLGARIAAANERS